MTSDQKFMKQAIALGRQAKGNTGDNPNVGCVIVKEGLIIGKGFTQPPGKPHAEIQAIHDAESHGHSVMGATVYSTLEPCSFFGRTPACAKTLCEHRVSRVVIGIRDPHPRVNGAGIAMLQEAGIEVIEGVCVSEVEESLQDWLSGFF